MRSTIIHGKLVARVSVESTAIGGVSTDTSFGPI